MLKNCKKITQKRKADDQDLTQGKREHNRIEKREVTVFSKNVKLNWSKEIKSIIKVKRTRKQFKTKLKQWKESLETSFYVSTIKLRASEFAEAIRNHWRIENRNHCVRDLTFQEDISRIRKNPDKFATLISFSLNVLRQNDVQNVSQERYKNSLNFDRILNYKRLLN